MITAIKDGMTAAATGPVSVDLFCGAGGLTLGLCAAGLRSALGSDFWHPAAQTFQRNLVGTPFAEADARDLSPQLLRRATGAGVAPDVIVGGPPCQGFSSAGSRKAGDHRNTLVSVFARLVAEVCPAVFVFENVEGFLTAGGGDFVLDLLDPVIEAGYQVTLCKVNVANYGVPQLRKRSIAIGALGRQPAPLTPTHRAFGAPGAARVRAAGADVVATLDEALANLPAAGSKNAPSDHGRPELGDIDALRTAALEPGQTMRDLPTELRHPSYLRRANRRVSDGTPTERRGGAPAGMRRLRGDEPSKAITGAASREFIHPYEDRPLTLRECARLQTFPDWFDFAGSRLQRATLIGNAVPPAFGQVIGRMIRDTLAQPIHADADAGRLLAFEPSAGEAFSPALAHVVALVKRRYRVGAGGHEELPLWA